MEGVNNALSPEEWADWIDTERGHRGHGVFVLRHQPGVVEQIAFRFADGIQIQANDEDAPPRVDFGDADRHALAALALHGQEFGFSREDVALLPRLFDSQFNDATYDERAALRTLMESLAARIEALLPPEDK